MTKTELARQLAEAHGGPVESWRRRVNRWTNGYILVPRRETAERLSVVLKRPPEFFLEVEGPASAFEVNGIKDDLEELHTTQAEQAQQIKQLTARVDALGAVLPARPVVAREDRPQPPRPDEDRDVPR